MGEDPVYHVKEVDLGTNTKTFNQSLFNISVMDNCKGTLTEGGILTRITNIKSKTDFTKDVPSILLKE